MAARKGTIKAKVEMDPTYKVPRRLYEIDEPASNGDPREVAEAFLRKAADDLQINPDLSGLRFDQVKESVLGSHALFQQQHGGRPVTGAWVRVDIDPAGKVYNVQSDLIPASVLGKAKAPAELAGSGIAKEEAIAKALTATGSTSDSPHAIHSTEQVAYPVDGQPTPAWKVVVVGDKPLGEWKVYVDAASGAVLGVVSLLKEGRGRIFDPHPVATLNDTTLEDTSTILEPAYTEVELVGLDGSGNLDGPFVSTVNTPARIKRDTVNSCSGAPTSRSKRSWSISISTGSSAIFNSLGSRTC